MDAYVLDHRGMLSGWSVPRCNSYPWRPILWYVLPDLRFGVIRRSIHPLFTVYGVTIVRAGAPLELAK